VLDDLDKELARRGHRFAGTLFAAPSLVPARTDPPAGAVGRSQRRVLRIAMASFAANPVAVGSTCPVVSSAISQFSF
jgi:hypothetical protein